MHHPNLLDKLRSRFNSHYLYPGQTCHTLATVVVGILHPTPDGKIMVWKPVGHREIKKDSHLKYLNYASKLPVDHTINKYDSIMEIVSAVSDFQINPGDVVLVTYSDRQFIAPSAP